MIQLAFQRYRLAANPKERKSVYTETDVAIIGGGPAGLMLAIELGCRGVRCVVLEEDIDPPNFPKANATSSRTMEHFRRRGFADTVRALGLAPDYPQDVVYCTTLVGHELTRFAIPSRNQILDRSGFGDYGEDSWPTPELPHRVQQMFIEPVLREQAQRYESVSLRCGWRAQAIEQLPQQVKIQAANTIADDTLNLQARFVVGCDGPRSLVRKSCGIRYAGQSEETREFFGGHMLSVFFRSKSLYPLLKKSPAWQYWAVNPIQRGLLMAIDGVDLFLFCLQLPTSESADTVDYRKAMFAAIGAPFEFELIGLAPWQAGHTLVADRFSQANAFIAGDAAHLFTPTGGMGYNTSVDDAVNLGWKLAAVIQGWADETLLASYELERKPIALRNTAFARAMADSIGGIKLPENLLAQDLEGDHDRETLGRALGQHVRAEFNIPGLQLGLRYEGSPIVAQETQLGPPDLPNAYVPNARPGARAPHLWLSGKSILDCFGRDFTIVCFYPKGRVRPLEEGRAWQKSASKLGIPLDVFFCDDDEARHLYEADQVLIRPDHHIAWRGHHCADKVAVLARSCSRQTALV
jgi:2-polyprenyl-6-methoxyphenol hydroxylase-like FAD-dependent oxidoreductase